MIYILSLSLQIAGALILLIRSVFGAINFDDGVLDMCLSPDNYTRAPIDENGIFYLEGRTLRTYSIKLCLNIFAFLNLFLGYFLGIWGSKDYSNIETALLVIIITSMLLIIEFIVSARFSGRRYPVDRQLGGLSEYRKSTRYNRHGD